MRLIKPEFKLKTKKAALKGRVRIRTA